MAHSSSTFGLESVYLGLLPQAKAIPDHLSKLTFILTELYKSIPSTELSYFSRFILWTGSSSNMGIAVTPQPTVLQATAKKNALTAAKELFPHVTDENIENFVFKILDSHEALVSACLTKKIDKVFKSTLAMHSLGIPDQIRRDLFNIIAYHPDNANEIGNQTLAEFACANHSIDILKLLFSAGASANLCTHVFFDFIGNKNKLIPYETLINMVDAVLSNHFDITQLIHGHNLLQHALSHDRKDITYIIAHKISALHAQGKITSQDLNTLCKQLAQTNQLRIFPVLAAHHNTYKSLGESNYHQLQALLDNLILFCSYVKLRIDSEALSLYLPQGKSMALKEIIETLKCLQTEIFSMTYSHIVHDTDMTSHIIEPLKKLDDIFSMSRITLYETNATASIEWKIFCKDNKEIFEKIQQDVTSTISTKLTYGR